MKYKSRAIALSYLKQGESSIISKIFTEEKGLQSFIIKGVRSKKSKKKPRSFPSITASKYKCKLHTKKKSSVHN